SLTAREAALRFWAGRFVLSGTARAIGLREVAAIGRDKGEPLDTYNLWKREHMTFPNGAHVVEGEIDRDTGAGELGGARSWTTRCHAPTPCRRSTSASTARPVRPIRWA